VEPPLTTAADTTCARKAVAIERKTVRLQLWARRARDHAMWNGGECAVMLARSLTSASMHWRTRRWTGCWRVSRRAGSGFRVQSRAAVAARARLWSPFCQADLMRCGPRVFAIAYPPSLILTSGTGRKLSISSAVGRPASSRL
jgi:hypothetical protein